MGGKIDLTEKQKENIEVSLSEEVYSGVGTFVPDLVILGATGGTMNALGYAKLMQKLSPMARFITGAIVEEAKMQTILDMKPGGGATFYTLGQATSSLTPFKSRFKWLDPLFQKVIKSGPVGAISAEGAQVSELAYESFMGDKNFKQEFEELYKDFSEVGRRALVNSMVFGATGFTHVKRGDFMSTRRKYEVVGELQAKVNKLMALPKETATSIEKSDGVTIPEALKPKKNFEDLSAKEQKQFMEYSKRIQTLNQQIQVETMYHKLDPNSKNFEKDFNELVTNPMNKGIKSVIPEFEGVKVKFGKGKEFRKQNFETNEKGQDLGHTAEYNPKTKEMFFDLDFYTSGKPVHEFTHAAVNAYFDANPNAKRNFTKRMRGIFEGFDFGDYEGTQLEAKIKEKYGTDLRTIDGKNLTAEEYISFMGEFLADPKLYYQNKDLASNLINEFKLEVKDILIESGLKTPIPKTAKDMVQLMALLGKSTRMGTKLDVKASVLAKLEEVDLLGVELVDANVKARNEKQRASLNLEGAVVKKSTPEILKENVDLRKEIRQNKDNLPTTEQRDRIVENNMGLVINAINKYESSTGFKLSKEVKEEAVFEMRLKLFEYANRYDASKNDVGAYLNLGFVKQVPNTLRDIGAFEQKVEVENFEEFFDKNLDFSSSSSETIRTDTQGKELQRALIEPISIVKDEARQESTTKSINDRFTEVPDSYKNTPDLSNISSEFGVRDNRINNEDGTIRVGSFKFKDSEFKSAQDKFSEPGFLEKWYNIAIPEGQAGSGAKEGIRGFDTGLQQTLKNIVYEKTEGRESTGPGKGTQNRKPFNEVELQLQKLLGIEPGKERVQNSKVNTALKNSIHQLGKSITNKIISEREGITPNQKENLISGKSPIRASIELTTGLEQAYDEIVKTGTLNKKSLLKSLTIPWEKESIENLNIRRFKSAIELGFINKQDLKKLTQLNLERDLNFYNNLAIENIAEREGETISTIIDRYMSEEISLITNGEKLKASMPGTIYRSAEQRATPENFKKAKPYYQDLIQRLIPEGYLFSQLPNAYQKMIMNTIGMGDHRGRTNGRKFTFKEYNLEGGSYIDLLEAVYGIKEANLKGKGPSIESFASDINIPAPTTSKLKASDAEINSRNLVDFKAEAAKAILGKGQFNVDVVLNANKAALQNVYNSAKEVVKNAKNPIEALDYMVDLMLEQTNRSIGGIKGLAGVESITMEGMRGSNPELTKELHNEHLTELFSMTKDFGKMMERFIKGEQSEASVDLQLKRMVEDYNQGIISEARREIKDFDGASIRSYIDNLIFLGKDATKQIPLRESTFAEAENMAEVIRNNATKTILNRINNTPYRKLTLAGALTKQRQMNKAEYEKIKNKNISEAKEYDIYASKDLSESQILDNISNRDKANENARKRNKIPKKARVFDFDDTVARTNSKVFATRDGKRKVLTAEGFAKQGEKLVNEGWKMDFSNFNKVVEGKKGPLFDLMKTIKESPGNRDMFILTARAPESAPAIKEFLKAMGVDIPLENIIGLGNSTGKAKANWIVSKAAEGYNDFYFADDAAQNVKAVRDALEVLDVKSKTQQAYASKDLSLDFNKLIEKTTGVEFYKEYSAAKAKTIGASKGKFKFWIPYSAEDFVGLIYPTLGKGRIGDKQMAWYKENLLNPYARAMDNLSRDRVQLMADFKALKKELDVPKDLRKTNETGMTNEQAVRVYLFDKAGYETPGLSKADKAELLDVVNKDGKLKAFADQIMSVTKGDGYANPGQNWTVGTITTDLIDLLNTTKRNKYLENWKQNIDQIYSTENLNKLEAIYGPKYRESLENIISRMKSGKNRLTQGNRLSNRVLDYINGSNAAIMFFNTRSAILQTISSINFVNWSFNNPLKAGAAFANQKQYWSDFTKLMNSDYLLDRRNGLRLNIAESEIADAAATSKNKVKGAIKYILEKGYLPTQYADSFAIASGGATFYRNRINDLVKNEGKSIKEAEAQAMVEWRQVSEESQQSSNPSKISSQQASDAGRLILMFANTPMQYARLQKRALQDLANGRGDAKSNVSKIIYYSFVQNIIFNSLQQALFKLGFDDEEDDATKNKAYFKTANGMIDSQLRGLGIGGAAVSVGKNFLLDIYERSGRKRPEYVDAAWKLTQFSPPISSKISRIKAAAYPFDNKKQREEIYSKGFSLDNPAVMSGAKVVSATTNIPLDRVLQKYDNVEAAMSEEADVWQSIAMMAGWPKWSIMDDKGNTPKPKTKEEKAKIKLDRANQKYKAATGSTDFETVKKLNRKQQMEMIKNLGVSRRKMNYLKKAKEQELIKYIIEKNKEQ